MRLVVRDRHVNDNSTNLCVRVCVREKRELFKMMKGLLWLLHDDAHLQPSSPAAYKENDFQREE